MDPDDFDYLGTNVHCDLLVAQVRGPNPGTWRSRRSTTAEQLPRNQWGGRIFGNFCDSQFTEKGHVTRHIKTIHYQLLL